MDCSGLIAKVFLVSLFYFLNEVFLSHVTHAGQYGGDGNPAGPTEYNGQNERQTSYNAEVSLPAGEHATREFADDKQTSSPHKSRFEGRVMNVSHLITDVDNSCRQKQWHALWANRNLLEASICAVRFLTPGYKALSSIAIPVSLYLAIYI